jgi:hypothetical protein
VLPERICLDREGGRGGGWTNVWTAVRMMGGNRHDYSWRRWLYVSGRDIALVAVGSVSVGHSSESVILL